MNLQGKASVNYAGKVHNDEGQPPLFIQKHGRTAADMEPEHAELFYGTEHPYEYGKVPACAFLVHSADSAWGYAQDSADAWMFLGGWRGTDALSNRSPLEGISYLSDLSRNPWRHIRASFELECLNSIILSKMKMTWQWREHEK